MEFDVLDRYRVLDAVVYVDFGSKYAIAVPEEKLQELQALVGKHMKIFGQLAYYREIDKTVDADIEDVS